MKERDQSHLERVRNARHLKEAETKRPAREHELLDELRADAAPPEAEAREEVLQERAGRLLSQAQRRKSQDATTTLEERRRDHETRDLSRPRPIEHRVPEGASAAFEAGTNVSPRVATSARRGRLILVAIGLGAAALIAWLISFPGDETKVRPTDPVRAALDRGLRAQAERKTEEAITAYKSALRLDPTNKYAHYDLGLIYQRLGRSAAAEKHYREALETDPNFRRALFNLAILKTGPDPETAVTYYERIIAGYPNFAPAHLNLGALLVSLGRKQQGSNEIRLALELDPRLTNRVPAALRP